MWLIFLFCLFFFPPSPAHLAFLSSFLLSPHLQSPAEVMMATVRRASPQTMRCSPCPIREPTPAQRPPNQTRPPQSLNPRRRWTFSALVGGTSAARVLHPNLLLLQPQPLTCLGTCLGGPPSQPVGRRLPSPHHRKGPQTPPHPARLLPHQVQHTPNSLHKTGIAVVIVTIPALDCC